MIHRFRILSALVLLFFPLTLHAQSSDPAGPFSDVQKTVTISSAAFTAVTMGSARETDAIKTQGFSSLTFFAAFTRNAASAVTLTCKGGPSSDDINYTVQVLTYSGSTAASDTHTWSQAVSGNESWPWTILINAGYNYVKCTFTATGGGASDLLTLKAWAR